MPTNITKILLFIAPPATFLKSSTKIRKNNKTLIHKHL